MPWFLFQTQNPHPARETKILPHDSFCVSGNQLTVLFGSLKGTIPSPSTYTREETKDKGKTGPLFRLMSNDLLRSPFFCPDCRWERNRRQPTLAQVLPRDRRAQNTNTIADSLAICSFLNETRTARDCNTRRKQTNTHTHYYATQKARRALWSDYRTHTINTPSFNECKVLEPQHSLSLNLRWAEKKC